MKLRVYYEDTDCGGIVYHSNYLNFCERARSEIFFQNSLELFKDNSKFVVVEVLAKFLKPAKLGDLLDIKTSIIEIKNSYVLLKQQIFKAHELIFVAEVKLAYLSYGKVAKIPLEFKTVFRDLKDA